MATKKVKGQKLDWGTFATPAESERLPSAPDLNREPYDRSRGRQNRDNDRGGDRGYQSRGGPSSSEQEGGWTRSDNGQSNRGGYSGGGGHGGGGGFPAGGEDEPWRRSNAGQSGRSDNYSSGSRNRDFDSRPEGHRLKLEPRTAPIAQNGSPQPSSQRSDPFGGAKPVPVLSPQDSTSAPPIPPATGESSDAPAPPVKVDKWDSLFKESGTRKTASPMGERIGSRGDGFGDGRRGGDRPRDGGGYRDGGGRGDNRFSRDDRGDGGRDRPGYGRDRDDRGGGGYGGGRGDRDGGGYGRDRDGGGGGRRDGGGSGYSRREVQEEITDPRFAKFNLNSSNDPLPSSSISNTNKLPTGPTAEQQKQAAEEKAAKKAARLEAERIQKEEADAKAQKEAEIKAEKEKKALDALLLAQSAAKDAYASKKLGKELTEFIKNMEVKPTGSTLMAEILNQSTEKDYNCSWMVNDKFGNALKYLLNDKIQEQSNTLYEVQRFCFTKDFPTITTKSDKKRNVVEIMFQVLYDQEIIDEYGFTDWKDGENEAIPGKIRTLFQVNSFLLWLAEVDEDDEEREEEKIDTLRATV